MLAMMSSASAKPLEYDYCQELKAEQRTLRNEGVEVNMRRGPNWAKANLTDKDLSQIRRYLTVEEQIKFRCGIKRKPKKPKTQTVTKPPKAMPMPDRYRFRQPPGVEDAELINAPPMTALPRAEPAKQVAPTTNLEEKPRQTATAPAEPAQLLAPGEQGPQPGPQSAALAAPQPTKPAKQVTPTADPAKPAAPAAQPAPKVGQKAALAVEPPEPAVPAPARKSDMLPPAPEPQPEPPVSVSIREIDTKEIAKGMGVEMRAEKPKTVTPRRRTIRRRKPQPTNEDKGWLSFD